MLGIFGTKFHICAAERVVKSMLKEFEESLKEKRKENSQEKKKPDAKAFILANRT